ncbi:Cof-type HAD-IIB family hydrolase [Gorillibacterium timonense]|uniref:Cof-type HAD-IIB family hydrolase n=1 Tax=Gorillibacterium timonense TaxID=1689269 RepID=UPI000A6AA08D|nr:Cof-type HAD-IIB family hydrolase [Gorillibacterium timonense]
MTPNSIKRYKLIALDMDGTVLNEESQISPENRKWMERAIEHGVPVMFATGRGLQSVQPYVQELGLASPMVAANGSEVWEAPGRLKTRHLMEVEWIHEMVELAKKHDSWFWGYAVEGLFNKERWLDDPGSVEWLKFGFYLEDAEVLAKIYAELEQTGRYELTNSHPFNIEVNPHGVSKESGMREVCDMLGITMDEVIAMGDSLNDLKMIRAAGLGIAMGNAQEEVKAAADYITALNTEDGVARAIEKFVFGG